MIQIVDQCANCGKTIYWGEEEGEHDPLDPKTWKYWRHEETRIGPCSWEVPIKRAQPVTNRTPPVGAEISDTLKAELKRHCPDEFPDY